MQLRNFILPCSLVLFTACTPHDEVLRLNGGPIEFHLVQGDKPGVFATYSGGTVSDQQILEQNPVESDLKTQESLIRLETVLRKFAADRKPAPGTTLQIFMAPPKKPLAELAKSWEINLPADTKVTFQAAAPDKDVIAQWGDTQVKAADADGASVRLALVRTRAYREDLNRLTGILIRRSLLDAAKAEHLEIDEYVKKHIGADETPLSDSEFAAFLESRGIKKGDVNPDQVKALHAIALEQRKSEKVQNYVVDHLLKGEVKVHKFPPTFKVQVPEGWAAIWGVKNAPVSILYFGDLVCGPCREGLKNTLALLNDYNGHIKIGFNFLFSPNDRESRMIAEAALCVQGQGTPYFRKFAALYATNPPGAEESDIEKAARDSGANVDAYKKCFLARTNQNLLNQHLEFAARVGVNSQPTVLVDGEPLAGSISESELRDVVARKVAAKSSWLGGLWRRLF